MAMKGKKQTPHSKFIVMLRLHDNFKVYVINHSIFHVRWFPLFEVISCLAYLSAFFHVKQTMETEDKERAKLKGLGEEKQNC